MDVEDTEMILIENKDVSSLFIKEEPLYLEEEENEEGISSLIDTAVKVELKDEEDKESKQFEEEQQFVLLGTNSVIKEEVTVEETAKQHSLQEYILPEDIDVVIKEEVQETESEQHTQESYLLIQVNEEVNPAEPNSIQRTTGSNQSETLVLYIDSSLLLKHHIPVDMEDGSQRSVCMKHVCDVCSTTFTKSPSLSKPKLMHSDVYKCDMCNKTFTHKRYLSDHKLLHGIKKYKCDICNKAFTWPRGLSQHKLIHNRVKKYKCDVCNKSYLHSGGLSQHKLIHASTKDYQCDVRHKAFTRPRILLQHK